MQLIELTPKTNKAKQRIKQHGNLWKLVRKVQDSQIDRPWLVTPVDCDDNSDSSRWINPDNDPDFIVNFMYER